MVVGRSPNRAYLAALAVTSVTAIIGQVRFIRSSLVLVAVSVAASHRPALHTLKRSYHPVLTLFRSPGIMLWSV